MADTYIDLDETQFYGAYAISVINSHVMGRVAAADPLLQYLVTELGESTTAVKGLSDSSRAAGAAVRKGSSDKRSPLQEAISVMGRFAKHLDTHPSGTVDRKFWFTQDGTATGVGRGAPRVLLTVTRIAAELGKDACTVREKATWAAEMNAAAAALAPVIAVASSASVAQAALTPELESARQAWLGSYGATKAGVECVLRLTGRMDLMKVVFHDLAVPAGTKVSAPIPAPSPEPPTPNPT